jgi:spore coat polysaccharide biosynthesis protein SpsF
MKIVAMIQARMASTRLPGKILADVAGEPLLSHVVRRVESAGKPDLIVVATTDLPGDDPTVGFCAERNIACFRGSEEDVLDRFYQAARHFSADILVRLTADCPLLDPQVIDKVINVFLQGGHDYVSNTLRPTYPDGLDTEVFDIAALERAWKNASLKSEREHVTPFIWKHPDLFRLANVENETDLHRWRWTVDMPEDLEFIREVYAGFKDRLIFDTKEIMDFLINNPHLQDINAAFDRNEGYQKSLEEDNKLQQ